MVQYLENNARVDDAQRCDVRPGERADLLPQSAKATNAQCNSLKSGGWLLCSRKYRRTHPHSGRNLRAGHGHEEGSAGGGGERIEGRVGGQVRCTRSDLRVGEGNGELSQ